MIGYGAEDDRELLAAWLWFEEEYVIIGLDFDGSSVMWRSVSGIRKSGDVSRHLASF